MFNLIMRHYDWNDRTGSMELERFFRYTDQAVAARFKDGELPALDRLTRLPCLFLPEGRHNEVAHVGTVTSARITGSEVKFDYVLDADVPPLTNGALFERRTQLDMDMHKYHFDWSHNHWGVKDVDLYRFLLRNVNPRRQRPIVFNLPDHEAIEAQLVSVMMPFDAAFNGVYVAINQAAENCGLRTRRADEIWEAPGIIQDVVSLIDRARIVVCDLTNRNPNVFYEAGIAHTLGREVIIIAQSEHDVPFDLRHLRHIRYVSNQEGLSALTLALQGRMETIAAN